MSARNVALYLKCFKLSSAYISWFKATALYLTQLFDVLRKTEAFNPLLHNVVCGFSSLDASKMDNNEWMI